jgi:hypothetical protein
VIAEHKSNSDSYDGEVEDISVDEFGGDSSVADVEIAGSDSDSSVDIQV